MLKPKEAKPCKDCKEDFKPFNTMQKRCLSCSIIHGKGIQKKEKKKANFRAKKEFYDNDRSTCIKKAEKACHAYIRERDKHLPCISCGNTNSGAQYHAGHWLAKGSHPELRFNELNINKQCAHCNMYKSGNQQPYRIALIEKIGIRSVEWLEGYHEPYKLTLDDIREITEYYKARYKLLNDV